MFRVMHHQLLVAVGKETFNFRRFIDFDISQKNFVFDIPDFKLFSCMRNQQVGRQRNLENVVVYDEGTSFNHKELFGCLNAMESNGSFVAISDASISIVVGKIFDDEFLANVDDFMHIFGRNIQQLYGELAGTHAQYLTFLVKAEGGD